jgi:hypothetical protein
MKLRARLTFTMLMPALGLTGALLLAIPSPGRAADTPAQLSAGFLDVSHGSYLRVQLDSTADNYGAFTVSIPGVGLVWPAAPAVATPVSPQVVKLRYDGNGSEDAEAHLDGEFGVGFQPGGPTQQITLRLVGQVDPTHRTASVEVWVNGTHYHIGATSAPSNAAAVVVAYLGAIRTSDWPALYGITDSSLRNGMTQTDFAAAMAGSEGTTGISDAKTTGPTTYTTNEAGISYARTPIRLTYGTGTAATTQDGTLVLIQDAGSWKVFTVT